MMVESKIFYICDRKRNCKNSASCGKYCNHTSDQDHAKNGAIFTPSETIGRFVEMPPTDGNVIYYFEQEAVE